MKLQVKHLTIFLILFLPEHSKKSPCQNRRFDNKPSQYLNSLALVMPTLSGPTNIPPWEAFKMEIPVFYSDIHNIREVYHDAVYYIDPFKPETMATGIQELINNKELKNKLIANGKRLFNTIDVDKEFDQFFEIIEKRRKVKETWELNI